MACFSSKHNLLTDWCSNLVVENKERNVESDSSVGSAGVAVSASKNLATKNRHVTDAAKESYSKSADRALVQQSVTQVEQGEAPPQTHHAEQKIVHVAVKIKEKDFLKLHLPEFSGVSFVKDHGTGELVVRGTALAVHLALQNLAMSYTSMTVRDMMNPSRAEVVVHANSGFDVLKNMMKSDAHSYDGHHFNIKTVSGGSSFVAQQSFLEMAQHYDAPRATAVDVEKNILGVKGAVPGPKKGNVVVVGA